MDIERLVFFPKGNGRVVQISSIRQVFPDL